MPALEKWVGDFRHATRSLVRAPGFTLIVLATLALAIGANTAIFSIVNVVLLKPLPFPHADRLVHIAGTAPGTDQPDELGVPDELYFEYRESVPALEDLALYGTGSSTTRAEGRVDQLFVTQATPSLFSTLEVQPLHGPLPTDQDDAPNATDEERGWTEILVAAALQGAIFAIVKAAVDRGGAVGIRQLTGKWPTD